MNVDLELQTLQAEHRRDLENGHLRERLRQLYRRSGQEIPQALAGRLVNLDQLIAALESGGRVAGLDDLIGQGLRPPHAWRYLNKLLQDTDFPEHSEGSECHLYSLGRYSPAAIPLLEHDRRYYAEPLIEHEITTRLVTRIHRSRFWLLFRAFDEDPNSPRTQELNPESLCHETLKLAVDNAELERIRLALSLNFKLYIREKTPVTTGKSSEVLAIGPYSPGLRVLLSQPEARLQAMNSESVVIEPLFQRSSDGPAPSRRKLAKALGLFPSDHACYRVNIEVVDFKALGKLVSSAEVHKFQTLAGHGFGFFFRSSH